MASYKVKKNGYFPRSYLDARRMLLFMVEQVFLLKGRFGGSIVQIHNAQ